MNRITIRIRKTIWIILLSIVSCAVWADIVIIANPDLPVSSLSREEIYRIYMGKTKFLSTGTKVIPIDQESGSAIREKFYNDIFHKSESEIKAYWSRVIFTGQGYPPIQEANDKAVLDAVSSNANCLGYIDRSALNPSVKVLFTLP